MKRAKQIAAGSTPLSEETDNKAIVLALREIAEGKVRVVYPSSSGKK
jgi:DNA-directed RNA polymerase omega subunit